MSTINNQINDYISQIFRTDTISANYGQQLPNLSDYSIVELKSKLSTALEYSGENSGKAAETIATAAVSILDDSSDPLLATSSSDSIQDLTDRFLVTLNIKVNLAIMLFLIILLIFYSYFLNADSNDNHNDNAKEEKLSFTNEDTYSDSEDDEKEEKKTLLKSSSSSSFSSVVVDDDELISSYVKLKQKKCYENIDFNLLWIIHSLFVIYVLSIWDISDVYHFFKVIFFFNKIPVVK